MSPKEKAKELVEKYKVFQYLIVANNYDYWIEVRKEIEQL